MKSLIVVKDLVKKYGKLTAVDGISFNVEKGEIFGLLGENGAGKTTTLEILEGIRKQTSGKAEVLGHDVRHNPRKIKDRIGVQLQSSAYFATLNLKEILSLFGSFYEKNADTDELLKMVELEDKAKSFVGNLSGGQKQRFSIIASLVNDPEIVFLDEPTTGLDPLARRNLWEIVKMIKKQGKTVILTTHYMEEAEVLCDRVAIMDQGKILMMGETPELVENVEVPFRIKFTIKKLSDGERARLSKFGEISQNERVNTYVLKFKCKEDLISGLKEIEKLNPDSFTVEKATLEDLFIQLTGKKIEEEEDGDTH